MLSLLLDAAGYYILAGFIFGIAFFLIGYRRLDPAAAGVSPAVRLLWVPACLLLWPLLAAKWVTGSADEPQIGGKASNKDRAAGA